MRFDSGDFKKVIGAFIVVGVFFGFMFILLFGEGNVIYGLLGILLIAAAVFGARLLRAEE